MIRQRVQDLQLVEALVLKVQFHTVLRPLFQTVFFLNKHPVRYNNFLQLYDPARHFVRPIA